MPHAAVDAALVHGAGPQLWLLEQPSLGGDQARPWRRAQVQAVVARYCRVEVSEVELGASAMGQLAIRPTPRLPHPPALSTSDAAGCLAIALQPEGALGVDVEGAEQLEQVQVAFASFATPQEQKDLASRHDDRPLALLGWWTAKEAVLKAVGVGVRLGPEQIALRLDGAGGWQVEALMGSAQLGQGWRLVQGQHPVGGRRCLWTVATSTRAPRRD